LLSADGLVTAFRLLGKTATGSAGRTLAERRASMTPDQVRGRLWAQRRKRVFNIGRSITPTPFLNSINMNPQQPIIVTARVAGRRTSSVGKETNSGSILLSL
jgi:hypothetical protein